MASGEGTNAMNLVSFFKKTGSAQVAMILTNNPKAGIIQKAGLAGIPCEVVGKDCYTDGESLNRLLHGLGATLVVLAGYLKQIPLRVVEEFKNRIVNIHPSLLPKFGGAGMYGTHVHEAVLAAGETESGITVHLVDEKYDQGPILLQKKIDIQPGWNAKLLQEEVHKLEYQYFPPAIQDYLKTLQAQ